MAGARNPEDGPGEAAGSGRRPRAIGAASSGPAALQSITGDPRRRRRRRQAQLARRRRALLADALTGVTIGLLVWSLEIGYVLQAAAAMVVYALLARSLRGLRGSASRSVSGFRADGSQPPMAVAGRRR